MITYLHPEDGTMEQLPDGTWKVYVWAKPKSMERCVGVKQEPRIDQKGVDKEKEVFSKHFVHKKIFLANDASTALSQVLLGDHPNVIRIGMTGYSSLVEEELKNYGVTVGAYERMCADILGLLIRAICEEFPQAIIALPEGASNLGIDKAIVRVARRFGLNHLGYSCPRFMMYVEDDDDFVIVAPNQPEYSKLFVSHTHILISAGGRYQALNFDIRGVIEEGQKVFFADIMPLLTTNEAIPPTRDSKGYIQDATGSIINTIRVYGGPIQRPDNFKLFLAWLIRDIIDDVRRLFPNLSYEEWERDLPKDFHLRTQQLLKGDDK